MGPTVKRQRTQILADRRLGKLQPGAIVPIMMGDASGTLEMTVDRIVRPGEMPPSFLPSIDYRLHRPAWHCDIAARIWLEPAAGASTCSTRSVITGNRFRAICRNPSAAS
jgi:hypothetical protein